MQTEMDEGSRHEQTLSWQNDKRGIVRKAIVRWRTYRPPEPLQTVIAEAHEGRAEPLSVAAGEP